MQQNFPQSCHLHDAKSDKSEPNQTRNMDYVTKMTHAKQYIKWK